ncbi:MAG: T9SS type A sorting domain-containing protein [Bacteroidia bacterium]
MKTTRTTTSLFLILFCLCVSYSASSQVIFDGINCNNEISAHGTGDEWGFPHAHDSDGVNPVSSNLQAFWARMDGPYIVLAFSREGPGNVGFALHMNIDCDTTTGNTTYKGADYALFFSIQTGVVQDSNIFIWDTVLLDYVTTGAEFYPRIGGSTCLDSTDEAFFEMRFRADSIFDPCNYTCANLQITQANIHAGVSFNSVIKDELALDIDVTINEKPTSGIAADDIVCVGDFVRISGDSSSANGSYADNGNSISLYEWDLSYDSDSFRIDYTGPFVDTVFLTADTHTLALRVYDVFGCPSEIDTFVITSHTRPTLIYDFYSGSNCVTLHCYSGGSLDNTGADNLLHYWNMGDGNVVPSDSFTHYYDSCKYHQMTIIVTDPDNPSECASDSVTISSVLDVNLLSFTAKEDGNEVSIKWNTTSELNTSHYLLSRSLDGVLYSELGIISAIGEQFDINNYVQLDQISPSSIVYYQLTHVDHSGIQTPLDITELRTAHLAYDMNLRPNPVSDELYVQSNLNAPYTLEVRDVLGKLIYRESCSSTQKTDKRIDVGDYRPGVYMVTIRSNRWMQTELFKVISQ